MTYRCETCGAILEIRPIRKESNLQPDSFFENGFNECCPYCESPHVKPYNPYEGK